jgi:hypothetical protein
MDIGRPVREVEFEPIPEEAPVQEPAVEPAPVVEPEREPVPA